MRFFVLLTLLMILGSPVYGFTYLCKVQESNAISTTISWGFEISNDFTQLTKVSFMDTETLKSRQYEVPLTVLYGDKKNLIAVQPIDGKHSDVIPLFVRIYWFDFEKNVMMSRFGNGVLENEFALFKCT